MGPADAAEVTETLARLGELVAAGGAVAAGAGARTWTVSALTLPAGVTPASVIGAKSLVTSNEVLYRLWITEKGRAAPNSV